MKKVLALLLVLGMASVASAAMTLVVGTDPQVPGSFYDPIDTQLVLMPSQTLWIGIYNDTAGVPGATGQGVWFLGIDTTGHVHNGSWTGAFVQYKPPLVAGAPENVYYGTTEADVYGDGSLLLDIWEVNMSDGNPTHFQGIGVLDAKEFHCDAMGDVVIDLLNDGMEIIDSIVIHQIPEPATIALLGLGGLLLKRRK